MMSLEPPFLFPVLSFWVGCSVIYAVLYPWLDRWWLPQPLILPAEVYKVGVTHYFSFLKARQELGYVPMVTPREGMAATIAYWQDRKRKSLDGPTIYPWLLVVIGMISTIAAAYFPEIGPLRPLKALLVFLFRSMWDGQASMRPSPGSSCWGGGVCISAREEGGSCEFERMVLANICSWYVFVAVFAEESADLTRPVRRYSRLLEKPDCELFFHTSAME